MAKKIAANTDPNYPALEDENNWKLSEFYFKHNQGLQKNDKSEVQDKLERTAGDQSSALAALGEEPEKKNKKGQSVDDKHKGGVAGVVRVSNKLHKIMIGVENRLPSLKRKLSPESYGHLKRGLEECRLSRESSLDSLEDLKECPQEEDVAWQSCEQLSKIAKSLSEHVECLQDAIRKHAAPDAPEIVKSEVAAAPEDGTTS